MMHKFIFLTLLINSCFIISCEKNQDKQAPTLELYSPKENDTLLSFNSEFEIKFKAHDETALSKAFISITDTNGTELTSDLRNIYGTDYYYSNSFLFSGTKGQIKKLNLLFKVSDKSENTTLKKMNFYIKL